MMLDNLQPWGPPVGGQQLGDDDWDSIALTLLKQDIARADGCSYAEAQAQVEAWMETPEGKARMAELRDRVRAAAIEQLASSC
jgi:hypothetical protein